MSDYTNVCISLGDFDYSRLESDEDYREVAWEKMPDACRQIGAALGEAAWDKLQDAFKGSRGIKLNRSSSDRRRFIEGAAQEFCGNNLGNKEIENYIIAQLREIKARLDAGETTP